MLAKSKLNSIIKKRNTRRWKKMWGMGKQIVWKIRTDTHRFLYVFMSFRIKEALK